MSGVRYVDRRGIVRWALPRPTGLPPKPEPPAAHRVVSILDRVAAELAVTPAPSKTQIAQLVEEFGGRRRLRQLIRKTRHRRPDDTSAAVVQNALDAINSRKATT